MPKNLDLNENLEKYIINHSENLHPIQNELIEENNKLGEIKRMQISISQAHFFQMVIKIAKIKNILEIGTFTGFSALSMALALPKDGKLITLDKDKKTSLKNIYNSPKDVFTLEKVGRWGVVQVVKVFLGMPVVPGR